METDLLKDKDLNLWAAIRLTERAIYKVREKEVAQFGITVEQAAVCFYIQVIGENATPAEISRWMLREPHTILGILDRMEKKGLVRKIKEPNRNRIRVYLTEDGRRVFLQSTKRESIQRIMSALSPEEHKLLKTCLNKLQDKAFKELGMHMKPGFPPLE